MPAARSSAVLFAAAVAITLLGACGGDEAAPEPSAAAPSSASATSAAAPSATPSAAPADEDGPVTVYSGRSEELVGPVLAGIEQRTGLDLEVRYGDTAELAALLLEEGAASPADLYFAQDAGALGALQAEGALAALPAELLERVDPRFASTEGDWVGVTGRARVIAHSTATVPAADVPASVLDLTDERWQARVGWAPSNGSFQAFVTAMRVSEGEDVARSWLAGMVANQARPYENNVAIIEALGRQEIDLGLVNHYYLERFLAEDPVFPVANSFPPGGDVGALVNVAGVGVLAAAQQPAGALAVADALLGVEAQTAFVTGSNEYPLLTGVTGPEGLPALDELDPPDVDLADLDDLQGTLELLRTSGALR